MWNNQNQQKVVVYESMEVTTYDAQEIMHGFANCRIDTNL